MTKRYTGEFALRPVLQQLPKQTLAILDRWSRTEDEFVRRLCIGSMRIKIAWGPQLTVALDYFVQYTTILTTLVSDDNNDVRRSAANNLNELTKEDLALGLELIDAWQKIPSDRVHQVITHGTRFVRKKGLINTSSSKWSSR